MRTSSLFAVALGLVIWFSGQAMPAHAATTSSVTTTLTPSADTYVLNTNPDVNYGGQETLYTSYQAGPLLARSLYKFNLSSIPTDAVIQSASFVFTYQSVSSHSTVNLTAARAVGAWTENTATWTNAPAVGDTISEHLTQSYSPEIFDITNAVSKWVKGDWQNDGLYVKIKDGESVTITDGIWSKEATQTDVVPTLTVTYTLTTVPPVPQPIVISNVHVAPGATAATISFNTNVNASGTIEYGTTETYGASRVEIDQPWVIHSMTLLGLVQGTTYHYRIRADAPNATTGYSADATFLATAPITTPPPALPVPAGSLVKTATDSAVYYVTSDGKRHAFPNAKIYASWYTNFTAIQAISAEVMAKLPLGSNVQYRPGTRMVKFQTLPAVYAVGKAGELRMIMSESLAAALYGSTWNTLVDDLSDAFFANYHTGADITSAANFSPTNETAAIGTIESNK